MTIQIVLIDLASLADLRGIAEGDGEEQRGDGQGEDQDVGEALHGLPRGTGDQLRVVPAGGT